MAAGHQEATLFIEKTITDAQFLVPGPTPGTVPVLSGSTQLGVIYLASGDVLSPNAGHPYFREVDDGPTHDLLQGASVADTSVITAVSEPSLPMSRQLAATSDLELTDGGALGALTIGLSTTNSDLLAAVSTGSIVTVTAEPGLLQSRLLAVSTDLSLTDGGALGSLTIGLSATNSARLALVGVASFVTVTTTPGLSGGRKLTVSSDLVIVDGGPGTTVAIGLSLANINALTGVKTGSIVMLAATPNIPQSRSLVVSADLLLTDGGAQSTITISLSATNSTKLATIGTASIVTVLSTPGLPQSRSLAVSADLLLTDGGALGSLTISLSATNSARLATIGTASFITGGPTPGLPQSRRLMVGTDLNLVDNGAGSSIEIFMSVPNSAALTGVRNGSIVMLSATPNIPQSRSLAVSADLLLTDGGLQGAITISLTAANANALTGVKTGSVVMLAATPNIPQSRTLTAGANITITDGGAQNTVTIAAAAIPAVLGPTAHTMTIDFNDGVNPIIPNVLSFSFTFYKIGRLVLALSIGASWLSTSLLPGTLTTHIGTEIPLAFRPALAVVLLPGNTVQGLGPTPAPSFSTHAFFPSGAITMNFAGVQPWPGAGIALIPALNFGGWDSQSWIWLGS